MKYVVGIIQTQNKIQFGRIQKKKLKKNVSTLLRAGTWRVLTNRRYQIDKRSGQIRAGQLPTI